jgi:Flp pilus assembly protein TadD
MPLNIIAAQDTRRAAIEQYQAGSKAFVEQNFDAAITALTRSLALQPRQLRVMRLLGLSYQLAGRMEEAEATFNDSVRLAPGDAESLFFLGRVYYIRNFFDKALPALQNASRSPSRPAETHRRQRRSISKRNATQGLRTLPST